MIVAILLTWIALLWLLVAVGVFERWAMWMKLSPLALYLILIVGLLVPMTHSAPLGKAAVLTYSVQVAPNVSGIVTEVPIKAGVALKKGEVLFKIDPAPFEAKVKQIEAQLGLARIRLEQKSELVGTGSGRRTELEQAQTDVDQLVAELDAAKWDLENATVRAPTDGYVPNQALQPGARINAGVPVMPYIDNSQQVVVMTVAQTDFRHIRSGQAAEIIFDMYPGQTFPGLVKYIVPANPTGQVTPGGLVISSKGASNEPFIVELQLDSPLDYLPPGALGEATVYTDTLRFTHPMRKVMLRMSSWLNYLPLH